MFQGDCLRVHWQVHLNILNSFHLIYQSSDKKVHSVFVIKRVTLGKDTGCIQAKKEKRKNPHINFIALDVGWDAVDFSVLFAAV